MKKIDKYGNYGYEGIHRVRVAKTTTVYEIYDVSGSAHDYEEAHNLALDKAQGSETDVKLVGTTHIHETKVKGSFLYNRLCLLYTSPSPRDLYQSRMPSSA